MESFTMKHLPIPKVLWLAPQAGRRSFGGRTVAVFSSGDYSLAVRDDGEIITDPAEVENFRPIREEQGEPVTRAALRFSRRIPAAFRAEFTYKMYWRYR